MIFFDWLSAKLSIEQQSGENSGTKIRKSKEMMKSLSFFIILLGFLSSLISSSSSSSLSPPTPSSSSSSISNVYGVSAFSTSSTLNPDLTFQPSSTPEERFYYQDNHLFSPRGILVPLEHAKKAISKVGGLITAMKTKNGIVILTSKKRLILS